MSPPEPPTDGSETARPSSSWRGGRPGKAASTVRRWQRTSAPGAVKTKRGRGGLSVPIRLGAVFVGAVVCLTAYVALILARPSQVPVIALTAPPYPNPLTPNGWSDEDVEGLADLDGQTIALHDARGTCGSRAAILEVLAERLDDVEKGEPHGPIVLYFSLHAAVDGRGRPCLVPPHASPIDSSTWLPVERIFSTLAARPGVASRDVLVVFDVNRLNVEWQLGVARNTFVERITSLLDSADGPRRRIPSLAVLTAAGIDEVSQTSRELGGSVFMHFLRSGLAGQADRFGSGGDGNSRVSLRELHAYVAHAVSEWCRKNRDATQSPTLSAAKGVDFPISWVYRRGLPERTPSPRSVPATEITDLWSRTERLKRFQPTRYAPLVWAELRRTLLYLEQAADAGTAYSAVARVTAEELDSRLTAFEKRAADPNGGPWGIFRANDAMPIVPVPARSLALRRMFGRDDGDKIAAWNAVGDELPPDRLLTLADEIDVTAGGPLDEAHFLRLLARSPAARASSSRLGAAVALHRMGEIAAAPGHVRAWPWVRDFVTRGDAARRRSEDALMAGGPEDAEAYEAAKADYREAITQSEAIHQTLELLDTVRADQVPLARWLTDARHRRAADDRPDHTTELIDGVLLPMIEETNRLANETLVSGRGTGTRPASVRKLHETLLAEFDRAYGRLLDEPERTAATLREIDIALSVSLLPSGTRRSLSPAQQRAALLQKRAEIARDLATTTAKTAGADPVRSAEPLRQRAARWQRHPLPAVFEGDLPAGAAWPQTIVDPADAERIGELVRGWLGTLSLSVAEESSRHSNAEKDAATASASPASGGDVRDLRRVVNRLRIAAPLKEFLPSTMPSPVERLMRLDLAELLTGHAKRKIDDFWGSASPNEPAFFASASDDLRTAGLLAGFDTDLARRIAETERLLELRTKAARDGLKVKVSEVLSTAPGRSSEANVTVGSNDDPTNSSIPAGTAAVVAGLMGRWDAASPRQLQLPVPSDGTDVELQIEATATEESEPTNRVAVLFRGHVFDAPLRVTTPAGPAVEFIPPAASPTTLTVRSTSRRGLSIVFVLDCSASMSESAGSEGSGSASTRLDLARSALGRMLGELAVRPKTRVGVVFYGHRVGWRKVMAEEAPERFQRSAQRAYARPVPDPVMPYDDVEVVEPLGRFDGAVAGEVSSLMESLRPWGETPLYLAIDAALRQFSDDDQDAERIVVVVTDGLNEQSNPSPAARKGPSDVLSTWERRPATIEIIGFGLSATDAGRAADEFGRLAETTGGTFESVNRATDLIGALERRIGPAVYHVRAPQGDPHSSPIGRPTDLAGLASLPSPFQVSVDGREAGVVAEGGEGLDLIADDTGPILSSRYTAGSPQFVPMISGEPARRSGALLGLHRPLRTTDDGVTFEFSIQNEDQTFRARPAAIWAEVTPVRADSSDAGEPYVFFHNRYVPGTPVPVVRWTAAGWPIDGAAARVRFWCRDTTVEPVGTISVEEILHGGVPRSLPALEGVEFDGYSIANAEGRQIEVIERHASGTSGVGSVGIHWSGSVEPSQILHRFDASHGIVVHTFRFDAATNGVTEGAQLVVLPRSAIEQGGMRLDRAAVIDVSTRGDLLVPFRAPYSADASPDSATSGDVTAPPLMAPMGQ